MATTTPTPVLAAAPAGDARRVLGAAAFTVLAWASAFVAIRHVGRSLGPGALAEGRLLVGAAVLGALQSRRAWVRPDRRAWLLIAVCGLAWFGAYNVALNAAERHLDAGTTAMLVNIGPILIAGLAGVLLHEGLPRWLGVGAAVAFAGTLLIGLATRDGDAGASTAGVGLCLLAAVTYAVGVIAQKPVLGAIPALQVTWLACTIGAVACLPFLPALARDASDASAGALAGMVYLGVVPTALAFSTWAFALARMPAGRLGVTTYLVPPLAALGGWALLGETPAALALAGGALCLAGVALTRRGA